MNTNFFVAESESEITQHDKVLFKSANEFSQFITTLAMENKETNTQTILKYCEDRDLDPENIVKLISKPLKDLLSVEMQEAGLLSPDSTAKLYM